MIRRRSSLTSTRIRPRPGGRSGDAGSRPPRRRRLRPACAPAACLGRPRSTLQRVDGLGERPPGPRSTTTRNVHISSPLGRTRCSGGRDRPTRHTWLTAVISSGPGSSNAVIAHITSRPVSRRRRQRRGGDGPCGDPSHDSRNRSNASTGWSAPRMAWNQSRTTRGGLLWYVRRRPSSHNLAVVPSALKGLTSGSGWDRVFPRHGRRKHRFRWRMVHHGAHPPLYSVQILQSRDS